jgi:simple sugar transport system permease protein
MLLQTLCDPITILTAGLVVGVRALLERTRFGLRLRGAGENPVACWNVGVPVVALRVQAVTLSGALGALGGVALAFDQHQFQAGMSGGRGFIALAAVIVGGWRVVPAMVSCLVFAFLDALQIALQDKFDVPAGVIQSLPYAATLLALVMVGLRSRQGGAGHGAPPAGLGKHAS